jgi:hypothetical protein
MGLILRIRATPTPGGADIGALVPRRQRNGVERIRVPGSKLAQFDHGKVCYVSGSVRFMSILFLDFRAENGLADQRKEVMSCR